MRAAIWLLFFAAVDPFRHFTRKPERRAQIVKKQIATLVLVIVVLVGMAAMNHLSGSEGEIAEFRSSSDVPYPLGLSEEDIYDSEDYQREEGFGCYRLIGDGIAYILGGYPDVQDPYHVVKIYVESDQYRILDICVGDSLGQAEDSLQEKGFQRQTSEDGSACFQKGELMLKLEVDGQSIKSILAEIQVTNKENVLF